MSAGEHDQALKTHLTALPPAQVLCFACACAERWAPVLEFASSELAGWVKAVIAEGWNLGGQNLLPALPLPYLEQLEQACWKELEELEKITDQRLKTLIVFGFGERQELRAVELLSRLLKTGNSKQKKLTVTALGKIGDSRALNALVAALSDNTVNVRRNSAWVLGEIGDLRAVQPLRQLAEAPNLPDDVGRVVQ